MVLFSIVGGGCVEDRTGPVPRFSFSSSTIMTREIPPLVVSQTVFEGKKGVEKHGLANTRSNLFE